MKYAILSVLIALATTSCQSTRNDVNEPRLTRHEHNLQVWLESNGPNAWQNDKKKVAVVCPGDDGHNAQRSAMLFEVD